MLVEYQQSLLASIAVRDVDGYPIERDGEQIALIFQQVGGSAQNQYLASFDQAAGLYKAVIKVYASQGEFRVALLTGDSSNADFAIDKGIRLTIECGSGFQLNPKGKCKAIEVSGQYPILGGIVGSLLLLLLLLLLYTLRRKRRRSKEFIMSFLKIEGLLGVRISFEAWFVASLCYIA